jgi:hypothetical protein
VGDNNAEPKGGSDKKHHRKGLEFPRRCAPASTTSAH